MTTLEHAAYQLRVSRSEDPLLSMEDQRRAVRENLARLGYHLDQVLGFGHDDVRELSADLFQP